MGGKKLRCGIKRPWMLGDRAAEARSTPFPSALTRFRQVRTIDDDAGSFFPQFFSSFDWEKMNRSKKVVFH